MKLLLVTLSVLAVSLTAALPSARKAAGTYEGLQEDFQKFLDLLPTDDIENIFFDYLFNDEEVQEAIEYCQSDEFKNLILETEKIPEYRNFLDYLQENGVDVYLWIKWLHDILGLPPFEPKTFSVKTGGIRGMLDEIEMILPYEEIKMLFYQLMETSDAFKNFINRLRSDEFKSFVEKLQKNTEIQNIVQKLKDHNVDVQLLIDLLNKIFGWDIPPPATTYNVNDDLKEFADLIPTEEVLGIALDYLFNDEDTQKLFEYFQSAECKQFVVETESIPAYRQGVQVIYEEGGADIYYIINKLHDALGLPHWNPRKYAAGDGVPGLIHDVLEVIPLQKMKELYDKKLQNSKDFGKLISVLKGDKIKSVIETLNDDKHFKDIEDLCEAYRVDIKPLIAFLNKLFGWHIHL